MSTALKTWKRRSQEQTEKDFSTIAQLYIFSNSISDIVAALNAEPNRQFPATYETIKQDLVNIRQGWQETKLLAIAESKAIELAKLDNLEHTYWKHYKRTDDIKALHGVAHCIQQRSSITGLQNAQIAQNNVQVVFAWGGDQAQIPQNEASGQTIAGTFARVEEEEEEQTSSG